MSSKLPVQKEYEVRFSPVQKISTWCGSTFRGFPHPRHDGFSKTRKVQFLFTVSSTYLGPVKCNFTTDFEL
jgi:hypothetical protein